MPLTFTSGSWDNAQTITVRGVDDGVQTAESYTATVSHSASSSDPLFAGTAVAYFPSDEVGVLYFYAPCERRQEDRVHSIQLAVLSTD